MRICTPLALLISLAACGGDSPTGTPDANVTGDAAVSRLVVVTCPATVPITVTAEEGQTARFTFTPSNTPIPTGSVVKFMMGLSHNVEPDITGSDPALHVDYRETKCFKFMSAGTYGFHCLPHGFRGSITAQ